MNASINPKTLSLGAGFLSPAVALLEGLPVLHSQASGLIIPARNTLGPQILVSLQRAVADGSVFGAVTGPKHSGKSAIVTEILASSKSKSRVCVDIRAPDQVSAKMAETLVEQVERVTIKHESGRMHVLIVVDNAHVASDELLNIFNRFAGVRSSLSNPQIILFGETDLWERLGSHHYTQLLRRLVVRARLF